MYKILEIYLIACMLNLISCWPSFQLYTKQQNLNSNLKSENISKSVFDFSKETKFLIHGFADNGFSKRIQLIKDQILSNDDVNVIIADWSEGAAAPLYLTARDNSKKLGKLISKFIIDTNISPNKVHCIGHSLGPLFKWVPKSNRLDKSDADLVDIIHTDNTLGIEDPIGHKDFYPNGGKNQQGCNYNLREVDHETISIDRVIQKYVKSLIYDTSDIFACNHIRAENYFAESIDSKSKFKAALCASYDKFKAGKCKCNHDIGCSSMGYWSNGTNEVGRFYLDTNKSEPYSID